MIRLDDISTTAPKDWTEKETEKKTKKLVKRLGDLQELMYAEGKHSVLVILQGMDGSGKDGAVHNVFADCRMTGMEITAFKKPTEEEFAHDFLWRIHKAVPAKGMIGIFNRSQYEDILIQRVHGWIDEERVAKRMQAINAFEELIQFDNHTHVFKFYLHISKDEQEKQLLQRMDDPEKHWKHNPGDWKEREYWDQYRQAYEYAINESTTPWHICPVDDRWYRNYFIAKTLVDALEKLDMNYPALETE
ncbi:MAG: polyphosphate kinase [Saprospiraceae bacterium]|jgi:PPK2 family polyphosphate:nucleotide phosphotransferase